MFFWRIWCDFYYFWLCKFFLEIFQNVIVTRETRTSENHFLSNIFYKIIGVFWVQNIAFWKVPQVNLTQSGSSDKELFLLKQASHLLFDYKMSHSLIHWILDYQSEVYEWILFFLNLISYKHIFIFLSKLNCRYLDNF